MRKFPGCVLLAAALVAVPGAQQPDTLDYAAIGQIRDEGLNRSQAMDTLFWLSPSGRSSRSGSRRSRILA